MSTHTPLSLYTYMKTGGPADEVVEVNTQTELIDQVTACHNQNRRFFILGGGSNTQFTDAGFRGLVIINRSKNLVIDPVTQKITVDSGCPVNLLVNQATLNSLSGLEWFLGLPGTVGGAIYNNSHFKNHLIGEVVESVTVLTPDNQIATLTHDELEFAYDYSRFHHAKDVILSITFKLTPKNIEIISATAKESLQIRSTTQPLSMPSSGCIFQNPPGDKSAGALIDSAGLKGTSVGGAVVSDVHANFIVNTGTATAADVHALANQIESVIHEKFGIALKREVFFINEFGERLTS